MSGLDSLVARSLITTIEENLGEKTFQRIEKRLFERYGINMTQAAEHFTKLDEVMREFFGSGAEGLERQCLQKVITLQKAEAEALEWFTIKNHSLAKVILEALGDKDKNAILTSTQGQSRITSEILETCKIPQTSGYRKVGQLIENGLLISDGTIKMRDDLEVIKYKSLFENLVINFEKNKVEVKIQVSKESLKKSSILQVISC